MRVACLILFADGRAPLEGCGVRVAGEAKYVDGTVAWRQEATMHARCLRDAGVLCMYGRGVDLTLPTPPPRPRLAPWRLAIDNLAPAAHVFSGRGR